MSELQCVARLKIHDGKLDEFKRLAAKCAELVLTKDTGTLQYELYFNSEHTECLVFERYRDSQACWIITRIWGTQWPRFFRHALHPEKYAERLARN
jgi:Antibiotic biosynthesis monooxygenase